MRSARRAAFTILSAFSLILFIALAVLWARSYRTSNQFVWTKFLFEDTHDPQESGVIPQDHFSVRGLFSTRGVVGVWQWEMTQDPPPDEWVGFEQSSTHPPEPLDKDAPWIVHVAFAFYKPPGLSESRLVISYAPLTALAAVLPFRWMRQTLPRTLAGRCRHCNYDLRAQRAGHRCPECGTLIA